MSSKLQASPLSAATEVVRVLMERICAGRPGQAGCFGEDDLCARLSQLSPVPWGRAWRVQLRRLFGCPVASSSGVLAYSYSRDYPSGLPIGIAAVSHTLARCVLLVNNLGATTPMEMTVVTAAALRECGRRGIAIRWALTLLLF